MKTVKLNWHTFPGGTGAAEGKYSYQAITGGLNGREMYLIDPTVYLNGKHRGYTLRYFGPSGYKLLEVNTRYSNLKNRAQQHYAELLRVKRNPRGTLAAHAAAVNPKRVSASSGRKPKKRAIAVDYVELRDSTGKVYGRFHSRHTTMADIKAMARIIAQQHGIAVSAHRVKR